LEHANCDAVKLKIFSSKVSLNFLLVAFFFADFDFRGIFILDTTVWLRTFRNATVSPVMADMSAFVGFLIFGIIWREQLIKNNQAGGIMPNFDEDFPPSP